jgi:dienelactone hydrolase
MSLVAPDRPTVRFTVSRPEGEGGDPMPVLLILGGLRSGRENLERLPPLGPNVLISVEYPDRDAIRDKTRSIPERILIARRVAEAIPEQLVAVLAWARLQPWADQRRMSILGYSLGAMFVPATQEKARANAIETHTTIMAFGGAELGRIIAATFHVESPVLREIVEALGAALLHPVEPAHFLGRMTGDILIINAEADELIPLESTALMTRLTPDPKWIVTMPGEHIDPRDPAMLQSVVDVTKAWLVERGAANPER